MRLPWTRTFAALTLCLTLLAACLLPLHAQEPPAPPDPITAPEPGVRQNENGALYRLPDQDAVEAAEFVPAASGGPDQYGYTWSDASINWIDAVGGGTDTGLSGPSENNATGAIALPFPFKYYENTYNAIYIAAPGYITFSPYVNWEQQFRPRMPSAPNNVISVYPSPLRLATNGGNNRVYYKFGGTAPNRYVVVEWLKVRDYWDDDDEFTFEAVLFENGDIWLQYLTMNYQNGWYCGAAAIEDSIGADGLVARDFCARINNNSAIRFIRPAPGARLNLYPLADGSFTTAGAAEVFRTSVRNLGDNGIDRFNVSADSPWKVSLTSAGGIPLQDSNGDGTPDTGPVAAKGKTIVQIVVEAPPIVTAGLGPNAVDSAETKVTFRSVLNPSLQRTVTIRTTVSAPFAQVFADGYAYAPQIMLNEPTLQSVTPLAAADHWFADVAVAARPGLGYAAAWRESDNGYALYARLTDLAGKPASGKVLVSGTVEGNAVADNWEPALAAAPDGNIAIAWWKRLYQEDGNRWLYNENVWFAVLNSSGGIVKPATRITSNNNFTEWGANGMAFYDAVSVASTANNQFVVAWMKEVDGGSTWSSDVEYAVMNSAGGIVRGLTLYSNAPDRSQGNANDPVVSRLSNGQVLLAFADGDVQYNILSNNGDVLQPQRELTVNGYPNYIDAAPVAGSNVLFTWYRFVSLGYEIEYAVVNADSGFVVKGQTTTPMLGDVGGYGTAIAPLPGQGAVVTWGAYDDSWLGAMTVNGQGDIISPPTIFRRLSFEALAAGMTIGRADFAHHNAPIAKLPTTQLKSDPLLTSSVNSGGPQGGVAGISINVINNGLQPASLPAVQATLPPELSFVSSVPLPSSVQPGSVDAGDTVTWQLPTLGFLDGGRILLATTVPSTTLGATYDVPFVLTTSSAQLDPNHGKDTTQIMEMGGVWLPMVRE